MRYAIKQSKNLYCRKLCDAMDSDPCGLGYKIVTRRLGALGPIRAMDPQTMSTIIDGLFPTHTVRTETPSEERRSDIPAITREELFRAVFSLKGDKAPGPDGTPEEVLKIIAV